MEIVERKPWGGNDPNSDHQMWSRWEVDVEGIVRDVPAPEVVENARRFFRQLFGTAGRVRVARMSRGKLTLVCEIEGPAVHDPDARTAATNQIREHFVKRGFGQDARCSVTASLLAGDEQNGRPRTQLVVLPTLKIGKVL